MDRERTDCGNSTGGPCMVKEDSFLTLNNLVPFCTETQNQIVVIVYNCNDKKCFIITWQLLPDLSERNSLKNDNFKFKKKKKKGMSFSNLIHFITFLAQVVYFLKEALFLLPTHQIYFSALLMVDLPCLLWNQETKLTAASRHPFCTVLMKQ